MDETAIKVEGVSKDFKLPHERNMTLKSHFVSLLKGEKSRTMATQHALKDISFGVKKGEFFGIVGRNGSGKSTLLKMLAGIYQPTKGKIHVRGKLVPFIELGVGFNPELTGRENVYLNGALLGFSEEEVSSFYDEVVEFAELGKFMDQKLKNYSSGMQVRLAFSMAIRAKADILLIDEVLAVGDADFQRKCFEYFNYLKKTTTTVIFVSHDMSAIREFCDKAIMIEESSLLAAGEATTIADMYSQLFIAHEKSSDEHKKHTGFLLNDTERWGDGRINIDKVNVTQKNGNIKISVAAKVVEEIDTIVYGVHILSQNGKEVTAMNNQMINAPSIKQPAVGSRLSIAWEMLNVFNDGQYFVTVTLVDSSGAALDWIKNAARFRVNRIERSTTPVLPPVKVKVKVDA